MLQIFGGKLHNWHAEIVDWKLFSFNEKVLQVKLPEQQQQISNCYIDNLACCKMDKRAIWKTFKDTFQIGKNFYNNLF